MAHALRKSPRVLMPSTWPPARVSFRLCSTPVTSSLPNLISSHFISPRSLGHGLSSMSWSSSHPMAFLGRRIQTLRLFQAPHQSLAAPLNSRGRPCPPSAEEYLTHAKLTDQSRRHSKNSRGVGTSFSSCCVSTRNDAQDLASRLLFAALSLKLPLRLSSLAIGI